ncbi:MAG: hypothetical protein KBT14_04455 [Proteobacteria bacterium]|nr:hypothetical protein [Candidatus Enterousia onthequi]
MVSQKNLGFWYTVCKGKKLRKSKEKLRIRESKNMSKKHIFLSIFSKIAISVCVFCAFFISPVFATLPSGYTELEYIESTGIQYIDTGIYADLNTKIDIDFSEQGSSGVNPAVFGSTESGDNSRSFFVAKNSAGTNWYANFDSIARTVIENPTIDKSRHNVVLSKNGWYYDDELRATWSNPTTWIQTNSIWLFARSVVSGGATNPSKTRIYFAKLYQSDLLVRDLIPAKRTSDSVIGMYDMVSNTFFTNKGTGDFIAGPIKYRNLFNKDNYMKTSDNLYVPAKGTGTTSISSDAASPYLVYIPVEPNATYSVMNFYSSVVPVRLRGCFTESVPAVGVPVIANEGSSTWDGVTPIILTNNNVGKYLVIQLCNASQLSQWDDIVSGLVVVENSVAPTSYVPYEYSTTEFGIKIATTKYVDEEFAAAEAKLATTVQTIESVVSRTITQTGQIQVLQDTKQTRPDESCPANMKCLLVQDEDGTPHWYPIIEP